MITWWVLFKQTLKEITPSGSGTLQAHCESRKAQELSGQEIAILSLRSRSTQEEYLYTSSVRERGTRVRVNHI